MPTQAQKRAPSEAQIRAQLERMLASKVFALSGRQSDFLKHVVDASLQGQAERLKEFALGVDVFERDEKFDPGVDSIVRVEASRLRSKIREYYERDGAGDPVIIRIPKGHYVPTFEISDSGREKHQRQWSTTVLAALVVAGIVAWLLYSQLAGRPATPTPTSSAEQTTLQRSIAVLPLRDRSVAPEDYFSEAMTDELVSSLASNDDLRVTAVASTLQFRDADMSMSNIANVLGVDYLVDGSVYRDVENVRITAQLISAINNEQVWATTLNRPASGLESIHSDVASAIAGQISGRLLPRDSAASGINPAAYEAYLKGRYFYNKFTADGYRRSMDFFQEAIDIEPDYADAYAGMASCHCLLAGHGLEMVSPIIAIPQAQQHALQARELDPGLAEPLAFLGIIDFKFNWSPVSAEARLLQAVRLNPSLYQAFVWHSQILEAMGRNDAAVEQALTAKRLNPLSLAASLNLGWQYYQAGMYVEADKEIDDLIEFSPGFWGGYWVKGHIYNRHHMYDNAMIQFRQAVQLGGGHSLPMSALGYTYAVAGKRNEALEIISNLERMSQSNYVSPFHVAMVYAGLNEPDEMFDWLERAYAVRARSLAWMQVANELEPFRSDPRYQDLLDRIGIMRRLESEHQARNGS